MHSQRKNDVSRANGREILFRVKLDDKVLLEREVNVISLRQFLDGCASYGIIDILRDGERLDVLLSHAEL